MSDTRLPLNIQLFADNSTADDGGTQQQQQDGGKGVEIDYEKIANILQGKRRTINAMPTLCTRTDQSVCQAFTI